MPAGGVRTRCERTEGQRTLDQIGGDRAADGVQQQRKAAFTGEKTGCGCVETTETVEALQGDLNQLLATPAIDQALGMQLLIRAGPFATQLQAGV